MYQFYVDPNQIEASRAVIVGADVNHIRNVLRMKPGEVVRVADGFGTCYEGKIGEICSDQVIVSLSGDAVESTELPVTVTLFQGLPKSDKMELIIQKNTELGVSSIVPVATSRAVVKLDEKKADSKVRRWNGIAEAAAKQSKRTLIPEVCPVINFKQALKDAAEYEVKLMPYENAEGMTFTRKCIGEIRPGAKVAVFIGPEGGFSEEEVEAASAAGFVPVTLGRRILRTETAGMSVLSMLAYALEP